MIVFVVYPCLTQVRRKIKECVERLFSEIGTDNLRIGITAHGDCNCCFEKSLIFISLDCCERDIYLTKHLPMTSNVDTIVQFVETVAPTYGGDAKVEFIKIDF